MADKNEKVKGHWLLDRDADYYWRQQKRAEAAAEPEEAPDPEEGRQHGFARPISKLRLGRGRSISRW